MMVSMTSACLACSGGEGACPAHGSHLAELEVTLDIGQRLDNRGQYHCQDRCLDHLGDHAGSSSDAGFRCDAGETGASSSALKYRYLPWARCRSAAGSPSGLTATCTFPSTSWNTACTVASRPARNRSCASVPRGDPARAAPGSIRTLLPRATGTPSMMTWSLSGDTLVSAPGSHHGTSGDAGPSACAERR